MNRYENNAPSLDVLVVRVRNTSGVEVDAPLMSPLSLLTSALSDKEVFENLQVPSFNGQLGPVCASRNFLTHPSLGPTEWPFPRLNNQVSLVHMCV